MHKSGSRNVDRLAGCAPVKAAGTKRLVEGFSRHSRRAKHLRVGDGELYAPLLLTIRAYATESWYGLARTSEAR